MSWLLGQSTQAAIVTKLTQLICGEIADDLGTTCASGDRWIRENVGIDGIITPNSVDVTPPAAPNRMGYWAQDDNSGSFATTNGHDSLLRQTAVGTTLAGATRAIASIVVITPNTVANNYSTMVLAVGVFNADLTSTLVVNVNVTPNAAGTFSITGFGTLSINNPVTGFVPVNTRWFRYFNTTFLGGVDYWPLWSRKGSGVTAPTYTISPTGTSGTDYDVCSENYVCLQFATGVSDFGHGLGIKTNTGLNGAQYTATWACSLFKARMLGNTDAVTLGQIDLEAGTPIQQRASDSVWQRCNGYKIPTWLRPFTSNSGLPGTALIQYWMSVKPYRIVIILNGDPGNSGKLSMNAITSITPTQPTLDLFPILFGQQSIDQTGGVGNSQVSVGRQFSLLQQKQFLSSGDALGTPRDWQTGFMRTGATAGSTFGNSSSGTTAPLANVLGTGLNINQLSTVPFYENKPQPVDGKWWMYRFLFDDGAPGGTAPNDIFYPRGYPTNDGIIWIPSVGWQSGDEILDSVSGKKWFLMGADYNGFLGKAAITTGVFGGGLAILED